MIPEKDEEYEKIIHENDTKVTPSNQGDQKSIFSGDNLSL